jgi:hypothetical protein
MVEMTDSPAGAAPLEQLLASGSMPAWLPQLLMALYDGQNPDSAARWVRQVADALRQVPFAVVHDWQASAVVPLMLQACDPASCQQDTGEPAAADLQQLHERAAAGERFDQAQWRAALEPALRELYRHAYSSAEAYATARASASAYASANNFSERGAIEFADAYAKLSTDSNRKSYAESNAIANAVVLSTAYASGDEQAYAETYPSALAHACAHAYANTANTANTADTAEQADRPQPDSGRQAGDKPTSQPTTQAERLLAAYTRLADGLVDSLSRAAR